MHQQVWGLTPFPVKKALNINFWSFVNTMKKTALAVLVLSMFAASSAMAAGNKNELSISGSIDSGTNKVTGQASTTQSSTTVMVGLGQYLTSQLVLKEVVYLMSTDSAGTKNETMAVGVGAKYYFGALNKGAFVPFAGGNVSYVSTKAAAVTYSGTGLAAGGGVSYFITEDVSADLELQAYSNSIKGNGFSITNSGTKVLFGTTVRF